MSAAPKHRNRAGRTSHTKAAGSNAEIVHGKNGDGQKKVAAAVKKETGANWSAGQSLTGAWRRRSNRKRRFGRESAPEALSEDQERRRNYQRLPRSPRSPPRPPPRPPRSPPRPPPPPPPPYPPRPPPPPERSVCGRASLTTRFRPPKF